MRDIVRVTTEDGKFVKDIPVAADGTFVVGGLPTGITVDGGKWYEPDDSDFDGDL